MNDKKIRDGYVSASDVFAQSRNIITIDLERYVESYLEDDNSVEAAYFDDFSEIDLEDNVYTDQDTVIQDEPLTIPVA